MSKKLWQSEKKSTLIPEISRYIFSPNLNADKQLLKYDVQGSIAHAKMLGKIDVISGEDSQKIVSCLEELMDNLESLSLEGFEDMHSAIEFHLTQHLGDIGKKIHTGRSRNDQVLLALRLFVVDSLKQSINEAQIFSTQVHKFAKTYEFVPMPGFTHMQHAMPSSFGQWAGAFLESLLNDINALRFAYDLNSQNVLGSAAGFGTSINVDRDFTTRELGMNNLVINPIFCQNSKGKFEIMTLSCVSQIMMTLAKMANDIIIFYSQEFRFITVDENITTGSSIMPQKRNLDVAEVMRAKSAEIFGQIARLYMTQHNLLSGYNKDLKFVKDIMLDCINTMNQSIKVATIMISGIHPNESRLREIFSNDPSIFAADEANNLVLNHGYSFRDAYHKIATEIDSLSSFDLDNNLKSKTHVGATGNLQLDEIIAKIKAVTATDTE